MKILITGSTGMLGTSLSRHFLSKGEELYGLSRGKISRPLFPNEHHFPADITDKEKCREILYAVKPDIVLHTAAISDVDFCEKSPEKAYQVNGEGTRILAESACEINAFFCYISSDYVFDGEKSSPYEEEDPCRPVNVYGKSKLLGEEYTRALCRRFFIIRTSWLFGENRDSFVHHVLQWAKMRREIRLVEDKWGNPTYTPDLAEAIGSLFEKNAPTGIYHITNKGGCSWLEYGKKVLECRSLNGVSVLPMGLEELRLPAKRPRRSLLNHGKFFKIAKKEIRPWEEALTEYLTLVYTDPSNKRL